jgi:hypothetical protein
MQIVVWYPAERETTRAMTLGEYVALSAGAPGPQSFTTAARERMLSAFAAQPLANGFARPTIDSVLATPLRGSLEPRRMPGRYPLVVFLHSSIWGASVMSEYLASHGFVVAAIESKGAQDMAYRLSRANLDAMVEDAAFVVSRLRKEPNVGDGLGIIGMSNGSIAGLALQLRGVTPDAVVSLDGGIAERAGGTFIAERSDSTPSKLTVPLLHLYTPDNPNLNIEYLRSYTRSSRTLVQINHLRHRDFLTGAALERLIPRAFGPAPPEAVEGFELINRYTLNFLASHIRRDASATRFLGNSPEANGAPAGLVKVEVFRPVR